MIIRVDTFIMTDVTLTGDGSYNPKMETTRDIDYRNKGHRIWLAKHIMWCFNNGRGVQSYRIA